MQPIRASLAAPHACTLRFDAVTSISCNNTHDVAVGLLGHVKGREDGDFVDRLHYRYTVFLLIIFSIIVSTRLYHGEPVICWCPAEFTGACASLLRQSRHLLVPRRVHRCVSVSTTTSPSFCWCPAEFTGANGTLSRPANAEWPDCVAGAFPSTPSIVLTRELIMPAADQRNSSPHQHKPCFFFYCSESVLFYTP